MRKTMGMWRERVTKTVTATSDTLYSEYVSEGERWFLQRVSVRNDTTANSTCLVSIDAGTHIHPLYYFTLTSANIEYSAAIECWMREGERLRFDWGATLSGDKLFVHITGHKQAAA
jgi:hypothetical protein